MTVILASTVMRGAATPRGVSAVERGCGHCYCGPAVRLCVGCGNDAQLGNGVRGPLLGRRFNCHGVCRGWWCS